jgi:hypothetical protein
VAEGDMAHIWETAGMTQRASTQNAKSSALARRRLIFELVADGAGSCTVISF